MTGPNLSEQDDDLVLDFFRDLEERKRPKDGDKLYPGTTPPRNVHQVASANSSVLWLTQLPYKEYLVGGVKRKFYTVGALATALGKKPVTIRSWESKGWLPKAKWRTPKPVSAQIPGKEPQGRRLYSEEQLTFLVSTYNEYIEDRTNPDWAGFRNKIKRQYPND